MSKKKKIIIIISIIAALLIAAGVILFFVLKNDDNDKKAKGDNTKVVEKITITFDADGGSKVEDITVKKGSSFQLPETTKEGYLFAGWYDGSKLITDDDTDKIVKNTVLTAKWEEVEEDEVVMTISFDSKGGSKVSNMTVKCVDGAATIKNLPKSKKDSYNFLSWEDKHGKSILDGAKITCEGDEPTLKLYAVWEYDGPTANPENNPETKVVSEKTYKCPAGYELKDKTRCVQFAEEEKYCDSGWKLVGSDCVNPASPNPKGTRTCPSKTYGGWTGTGTYYEAGAGYCGYQELTSYIGQRDNCRNNGGTLAANNHCYKYTVINGYTTECASGEKKFGAQVIAPGNGGGCYQVKTPGKKCPTGYTNASVYGGCAKIIDATLE